MPFTSSFPRETEHIRGSPEEQKKRALELAEIRLLNGMQSHINIRKEYFVSLISKLDAMSPLKVLTRGYSIAQLPSGDTIRSVRQVSCGDEITIRLSDGAMDATITELRGE